MLIFVRENEQGTQTEFVPLRTRRLRRFPDGEVRERLRGAARGGIADAEEFVAFGILAFPRLEEILKHRRVGRIRLREHGVFEVGRDGVVAGTVAFLC